MIYLTNDEMDQGVYFDLRKTEPRRKEGGTERLFHGLLGNGIMEMPVTVRSWRDGLEMVFGGSRLFTVVEEKTIRRMLGEVVRELELH